MQQLETSVVLRSISPLKLIEAHADAFFARDIVVREKVTRDYLFQFRVVIVFFQRYGFGDRDLRLGLFGPKRDLVDFLELGIHLEI